MTNVDNSKQRLTEQWTWKKNGQTHFSILIKRGVKYAFDVFLYRTKQVFVRFVCAWHSPLKVDPQ